MKIVLNTLFFLLFFIFLNNYHTKLLSSKSFLKATDSLIENAQICINNPMKQEAYLHLSTVDSTHSFKVGLFNKNFQISSENQNFLIFSRKLASIQGNSVLLNSLSFKEDFHVNQITQWKLFDESNFAQNKTETGFDFNLITECLQIKMLGGNCLTSNKELTRTYLNLPRHNEVMIEGLVHHIGEWDNETLYIKAKGVNINSEAKYLFTSLCKNSKNLEKVFKCGYSVCKLSVPFKISFKHFEESLAIVFGSTLNDDSCKASFGISNFKVYIK